MRLAGQILPSGPGYPQANNQRLIVSLIYAAQKRVVITTSLPKTERGKLDRRSLAQRWLSNQPDFKRT